MKKKCLLRKNLSVVLVSIACMQYAAADAMVQSQAEAVAQHSIEYVSDNRAEAVYGSSNLYSGFYAVVGGVSYMASGAANLAHYVYNGVSSYMMGSTDQTPAIDASTLPDATPSGNGGPPPPPPNGPLFVSDPRIEANNDRFNQLQSDMQKNDKKAMRGIAAIAAMGNAVFPSAPGKTAIGAGIGSYEGVQAFAITVSHRPEKLSQMSFQGGIASSAGGKPVMRVGVSYEF